MKLSLIAVAAAGLLAASARAQVSWERDPLAGILAQARVQAKFVATPQAAAAMPAAKIRLQGKLIGDGRLSSYSGRPEVSLILTLNDDKTVVGVVARVTDSSPSGDYAPSDTITYAFPQLRYDGKTKQVLLGDVVIGKDRGFFRGGLQFVKGYEALSAFVSTKASDGFNHWSVPTLDVVIVQK